LLQLFTRERRRGFRLVDRLVPFLRCFVEPGNAVAVRRTLALRSGPCVSVRVHHKWTPRVFRVVYSAPGRLIRGEPAGRRGAGRGPRRTSCRSSPTARLPIDQRSPPQYPAARGHIAAAQPGFPAGRRGAGRAASAGASAGDSGEGSDRGAGGAGGDACDACDGGVSDSERGSRVAALCVAAVCRAASLLRPVLRCLESPSVGGGGRGVGMDSARRWHGFGAALRWCEFEPY